MRQSVGGLKPLGGDVRVDLGRAEAGVTEDLLDGSQVRAAVEQVGGRGVAQGVRADRLRADDRRKDPSDELVHGPRSDPGAAAAEDHGRCE